MKSNTKSGITLPLHRLELVLSPEVLREAYREASLKTRQHMMEELAMLDELSDGTERLADL